MGYRPEMFMNARCNHVSEKSTAFTMGIVTRVVHDAINFVFKGVSLNEISKAAHGGNSGLAMIKREFLCHSLRLCASVIHA
jgi:hypothetical protein